MNILPFNKYDRQLIKYCLETGLNEETSVMILLSQNKYQIEKILQQKRIKRYFIVLINVLKLKKLSAEMRFRENYAIKSSNDIQILLSKGNIW